MLYSQLSCALALVDLDVKVMFIFDDGWNGFICFPTLKSSKVKVSSAKTEASLHKKLLENSLYSVYRQELNSDATEECRVPSIKTVLFICTHNSARSQMAEAFLNALCRDKYEAESAGITPTQINPYVAKVMAEIGIDLSTHRSKSILEFQGKTFNYVVTVCDAAREACPFFPGEKEINKSFPDPSAFKGREEEILQKVRVLRDEIKSWVENTFCTGNIPRSDLVELFRE